MSKYETGCQDKSPFRFIPSVSHAHTQIKRGGGRGCEESHREREREREREERGGGQIDVGGGAGKRRII